MYKEYIEDNGERYDLKHLGRFTFEAVQAATGDKPELRTEIEVDFSWHCYTRKPLDNETEIVHVKRKEPRCFCPIRYEYSKRLPEIIRDLSERKILQTGKGNFLTIEIIDEDGVRRHYEIYFTLRKQERGQSLKLFVESAYIRIKEATAQRRRHQAIKFNILVYKVKSGQRVPYKK